MAQFQFKNNGSCIEENGSISMELPTKRNTITKLNHFRTDVICALHSLVPGFLFFLLLFFFVFPFVIFQRQGSVRIHNVKDREGKRVVVEKNYAIHQLLKSHFSELQLVEVDFSTEAIERLAEGQADASVSSLMAGHYLSLAHGFPNIVVAAPAPFEPNRL